MSFVVEIDGAHVPGGVRVDDRQVIMGECRFFGRGGEIHVVFSQQDLFLQVMMKDLDSAALTGSAATWPD